MKYWPTKAGVSEGTRKRQLGQSCVQANHVSQGDHVVQLAILVLQAACGAEARLVKVRVARVVRRAGRRGRVHAVELVDGARPGL